MKKKLQAPTAIVNQFANWCAPRRGETNPESQTNAVWSWLVQTQAWPGAAHKAAGTGEKKSPGWCFSRYGQSKTQLSDGTIVYIGGEHEDHYDPDFYIYNDVVVVRPDSSIEIYGYPTDVFPPTDFHSATQIGDDIIIIGGLRYPEDRCDTETRVYRLQLSDFSIHRVATQKQAPPWLYDHRAELDVGRSKIVCTGGQVTHHPSKTTVENLTVWEFDLVEKSWHSLAGKPFKRWLLVREDESLNELWQIEQVARASRLSRQDSFAEKYRAEFEARGHIVNADLFYSRFSPPIPHSVVERDPNSDEYRVHRVLIDGVVVRYVEDMHAITVTVEGALSLEKRKALKCHGLETFSGLEGVAYKIVQL
ncbi:MAG: hypothetical protein GQ535_13860 [Rhodobacteraceae bacterium]|nr:hypothetical protein [Paracoccaceae bacterium]